jgi:hypothetical protein
MYEKALSYSSVSKFKTCPAQWEWSYILGHWEKSGPAAQRGTELHDTLETYYRHPQSSLPHKEAIWKPWLPLLTGLREHSPTAEGEVAVNKYWEPCDYKSKEAYYRGKVDLNLHARNHLFLFDWKSGKAYDEHWQQGAHYAALSPGYDFYTVFFVYLDQPTLIKRWEYTKDEVADIREDAVELIEEVRSATHYPFNKGPHCRWCPRSKNKGGDCRYG